MIATAPRLATDWIRNQALTFASLDPTGSLDDLEFLRDLVADARVVAIGESAHHVREFYLLRHRLVRFLVERMGFDTYALEAPFTESRAIDDWIQGLPGEVAQIADRSVAFSMGRPAEAHVILGWLRDHNRTAASPVRFVGTDVPGSGGSPIPALQAVHAYLVDADPDAAPLAQHAIELAGRFDARGFLPMSRYTELDVAVRDELTSILSRLLARLEATRAFQRQVGRGRAHDTALQDLRGAWHLDHFLRDLAGGGIEATGGTSRDAYIAESVLRLLDEGGPHRRIILAAHNWHLQRTAVPQASLAPLLPAGFHLAEALGGDYLPMAVTAGAGETGQLELDAAAPLGYRIAARDLPPVTEGSIETAFSGVRGVAVADLRPARAVADARSLGQIRMEHYFIDAPVVDAFDAIAHIDRTTVAAGVTTP